MAIVFDSNKEATVQGSGVGTTLTVAYTVGTGSDRLLVVGVGKQSSNTCLGVTFDEVAMTKIEGPVTLYNASESCYLFYLLAPASGEHNIVATFSSATGPCFFAVVSYSGVAQEAPEDHGNSYNLGTVTTMTKSLTTVSAGSWIVGFCRSNNTQTAGTNTYLRGTASNLMMVDTNGASDATKALQCTQKSSTGGGMAIMSIKAVSVVVPTVTTQAVSSISTTTATGNGNITATGGANADHRGFVVDTETHGAPGNVAPSSSGYDNSLNEDASGDFGTGAFTATLGTASALTENTTYYARAYAHNSAGYAYGDEVTFKTDNVVLATKDTAYKIRGKSSVAKDSAYKVRAKITATDKTTAYKIKGKVSVDLSSAYRIGLTISPTTIDSAYFIRVKTAVEESSAYSVRAKITAGTKSSAYAIRGKSSTDQTSTYSIRGKLTNEISSAYRLATPNVQTKSSGYRIKIPPMVIDSSYSIKSSIEDEKDSVHAIRAKTSELKSTEYAIKSGVIDSVSSTYTVKSSTIQSVDSSYVIHDAESVTETKNSAYFVRVKYTATKQSTYSIAIGVISVPSAYKIKSSSVLNKTSAYEMRHCPYSRKTSPYSSKTSPYISIPC